MQDATSVSPRRRFAKAGSVLEQRYVRASQARTPRERVAASALDAITAFVPAPLALLYAVNDGVIVPRLALRARSCALPDTDEVARRLAALEPIDPFSVRRTTAVGRTVMSAADVGGEEALRRSMFGRHLRRLGLGAPLHAYFRENGLVIAGLALLRHAADPPFSPAEVRLLSHLDPLVENALCRRDDVSRMPQLPEDLLTAREHDVARLVLDGVSNAFVAARLGMSEATVKTHLTRVYSKLGIRGRTELATQFRAPERSA